MADGLLLQERHRAQLDRLFAEHLPEVEVWAYGSRVTGRAHEGSDLDLALRAPGGAEIEPARLGAFCRALEASTIPFLVQPQDWARLPDRFRREIERGYTVLRPGRDTEKSMAGSC
ncbi:MAG: nucleotidyltransferase domain-containing protein [Alphaproteobacteria bacterium]|nr:nucleotidyltransferase domain-containing protein [Alphaproteobacteria bacterium]